MSPTAPSTPPPASDAARATTAPHQALYRRWRAQTFSEIVGQGAVVETLRNAVRTDRVSHAVLFVGPRGTGKTSLARILAKALNCTNLQDGDPCDACEACVAIREGRAMDLIEIDAASNRGIDAIRDLRERIHYAPTDLRRKVYILDEAHQITKDAWNALLKSLEEPPDFVAFMFASTHPQDFPPAILSRLQRFDVRRLTIDEIEGKLTRILAAESVVAEPAAVRLIAHLAAGGMRDAESILDQLLGSAAGSIDEATVRDLLGLADADAVGRLSAALVGGDAGTGLAVLTELDERGRDVAVVLDQILDQIRSDLAAAIGPAGDAAAAAALAAAAHRLAAIDPERRGVGGPPVPAGARAARRGDAARGERRDRSSDSAACPRQRAAAHPPARRRHAPADAIVAPPVAAPPNEAGPVEPVTEAATRSTGPAAPGGPARPIRQPGRDRPPMPSRPATSRPPRRTPRPGPRPARRPMRALRRHRQRSSRRRGSTSSARPGRRSSRP